MDFTCGDILRKEMNNGDEKRPRGANSDTGELVCFSAKYGAKKSYDLEGSRATAMSDGC
jgi:hypothetical protein